MVDFTNFCVKLYTPSMQRVAINLCDISEELVYVSSVLQSSHPTIPIAPRGLQGCYIYYSIFIRSNWQFPVLIITALKIFRLEYTLVVLKLEAIQQNVGGYKPRPYSMYTDEIKGFEREASQ